MKTIRAVLIVVDGVPCVRDAPISGALEAMAALRHGDIGFRLVTNTTRRTRAEIVQQLGAIGFDIALHAQALAVFGLGERRDRRGSA